MLLASHSHLRRSWLAATLNTTLSFVVLLAALATCCFNFGMNALFGIPTVVVVVHCSLADQSWFGVVGLSGTAVRTAHPDAQKRSMK